VPTLQTIPEERGEDGAAVMDDPSANSNTNNSTLLPPVVAYSNSNANNSAGNIAIVHLLDAEYTMFSLSPPPPMMGGNCSRKAWTEVLPRSVDDDGFETVDLFTS